MQPDSRGREGVQALRDPPRNGRHPYDDRLYNAARNLVDRIEVVDPERTSDISQPWLKQALLWSIGGLGFSADDVKGLLEDA